MSSEENTPETQEQTPVVEETPTEVPVAEAEAEAPVTEAEVEADAPVAEAEVEADAPATEAATEAPAAEVEADAPAAEAETEADAPAAEAPTEEAAPVAPAATSIDDLRVGMEFQGKVKAIELYGAFVDIGIGKDALLHISQLGQRDVRNVEDVVKAGETITVFVLKVDKGSGRVALSLEKPPEMPWNQVREGMSVTGTVVRIESFGAFVDIGAERPGMIHVSELASGIVNSTEDEVSMGDEITAKVIKVNRRKRQIDLSVRALEEEEAAQEMAAAVGDDEEEMPTAMELALRRAMEEAREDARAVSEKSTKASKKRKKDLDSILDRTLRDHSNN